MRMNDDASILPGGCSRFRVYDQPDYIDGGRFEHLPALLTCLLLHRTFSRLASLESTRAALTIMANGSVPPYWHIRASSGVSSATDGLIPPLFTAGTIGCAAADTHVKMTSTKQVPFCTDSGRMIEYADGRWHQSVPTARTIAEVPDGRSGRASAGSCRCSRGRKVDRSLRRIHRRLSRARR